MAATAKHKSMTARLRGLVKEAEISNARVRIDPGTRNQIQVFPDTFEGRFTPAEARKISEIAAGEGLTHVRGLPIDHEISEQTGGPGFVFENPDI